jgi:hypothetical protein
MHTISRDTPALYLTAVAKDRLPVFRTDAIKAIACKALDEARKAALPFTLMSSCLIICMR